MPEKFKIDKYLLVNSKLCNLINERKTYFQIFATNVFLNTLGSAKFLKLQYKNARGKNLLKSIDMHLRDLIEELKHKEVEVTFSEGKLKYKGPEENITPELIEKLKQNRSGLIKYLWPKELDILMPVNPQGNKVPLFIIHGDNSNYIISEYLGEDQPVYGFFHPGSEGEGVKYKSVRQMASAYLEQMLAVWPSGPYFLLGYSFGGIIAFEMAVQLQKMGKEVPFLVLIDTISPVVRQPFIREKNIYQTLRINYLRPVRLWFKRKRKLMACNFYLLRGKPIPMERRNYYLMVKYRHLTRIYKPSKFSGDMLLFRATQNPCTLQYLGWEKLVNKIRAVEIDGKHLDVFVGKERSDILRIEIERYLNYVNKMN